MKRLAFVLLAIASAGCQTTDSTVLNPFLGRSTVPPPGTAAPTAGPAPYYGGGTATAPGPIPSGGVGGAPLTPPGSQYNYQGSSSSRPSAWQPSDRAEVADSETPAVADRRNVPFGTVTVPGDDEAVDLRAVDPGVVPANYEEPTDAQAPPVNEPAVVPGSVRRATSAGQLLADEVSQALAAAPEVDLDAMLDAELDDSPEGTTIRIVDSAPQSAQPARRFAQAARPADQGTAANTWIGSERQGATSGTPATFAGYRGTGGGEVTEATGKDAAAGANGTDAQRYAFAANYRRLRGRLEYSAAQRVWRLRYIPAAGVNGQTDEYGGSVLLDDGSLLAGYESGDFVEVEGRPLRAAADDAGFAPRYELERIVGQ